MRGYDKEPIVATEKYKIISKAINFRIKEKFICITYFLSLLKEFKEQPLYFIGGIFGKNIQGNIFDSLTIGILFSL